MTVKELIAKLKNYDEDSEVTLWNFGELVSVDFVYGKHRGSYRKDGKEIAISDQSPVVELE